MRHRRLTIFSLLCGLAASVAGEAEAEPAGLKWGPDVSGGTSTSQRLDKGQVQPQATPGCASCVFSPPRSYDEVSRVWGSPLRLTLAESAPLRANASLAGSYDMPGSSAPPSLGEYLDRGRVRAWLQSELQWTHPGELTWFALDARWSPADLDGLTSASPFQATATLTLPW